MSSESGENIAGNSAGAGAAAGAPEETTSMILSIINDIIYSPINLGLVLIIAFLIYKIIKDRFEVPGAGTQKPPEPQLPRLRRDFTVEELRAYDGTQPDGRVLIAVMGNVYDVTREKRFYGPGSPYHCFAGRDASRNLATFSITVQNSNEYDDLSDLSKMEMDSVIEWDTQFKEKYYLVGKLLRKGEEPTNYDDEEDDSNPDEENDQKPKTATNATAAATPTASTTTTTTTTTNPNPINTTADTINTNTTTTAATSAAEPVHDDDLKKRL